MLLYLSDALRIKIETPVSMNTHILWKSSFTFLFENFQIKYTGKIEFLAANTIEFTTINRKFNKKSNMFTKYKIESVYRKVFQVCTVMCHLICICLAFHGAKKINLHFGNVEFVNNVAMNIRKWLTMKILKGKEWNLGDTGSRNLANEYIKMKTKRRRNAYTLFWCQFDS